MSPIWVAHTNNVRHGNNNAHIVAPVNASTNAARQQDSTTSILRNSQPPPRGENKNCNDNNNNKPPIWSYQLAPYPNYMGPISNLIVNIRHGHALEMTREVARDPVINKQPNRGGSTVLQIQELGDILIWSAESSPNRTMWCWMGGSVFVSRVW